MTINLNILGEPKSQLRHRHANIGGFIHTYDPSAKEKKSFLSIVQEKAPKVPIDEPISLSINFFMQRPRAHYGTGKNKDTLKSSAPLYHTKKPDLDNLVKFVKDSLNKVYWRDDSLVWKLFARKQYSINPRTEILIETL